MDNVTFEAISIFDSHCDRKTMEGQNTGAQSLCKKSVTQIAVNKVGDAVPEDHF